MRTRLLAALGAALLVLPLSAATAKPAKPHRVSPASGVSITVPDGFMACDAATNRVLGNAAHPIAMNQVCSQWTSSGRKIVMVNPDPALPLLVVTEFTGDYAFPDKFIQTATPQTMKLANDSICGEIIKRSYSATGCVIGTTTVGGHPAFSGDATVMGARQQLKFYLLSGNAGAFLLMFVTPLPMRAEVRAEEEAIKNSLQIDPAPPPPAPDYVQMSPQPGMTVSVQKGWVACDAANNALLGGAPDPDNLEKDICSNPLPSKITVFDPHQLHSVSVDFFHEDTKVDDDRFSKSLGPNQLKQSRDAECRRLVQPLLDRGNSLGACNSFSRLIGGRQAKVIEVTVSDVPVGPDQKTDLNIRVILVPYDQGLLEIHINAASLIRPMTDDAIDALLNSIAFQ